MQTTRVHPKRQLATISSVVAAVLIGTANLVTAQIPLPRLPIPTRALPHDLSVQVDAPVALTNFNLVWIPVTINHTRATNADGTPCVACGATVSFYITLRLTGLEFVQLNTGFGNIVNPAIVDWCVPLDWDGDSSNIQCLKGA
jgi:hypothetical protein